MTNNHLTDSAIQEYALDKLGCEKQIIEHIMACDDCRARAHTYQSFLGILKTEEAPVFDFDLVNAVMSKLPVEAASKTSSENSFIYWMIMLASVTLFIPVYLFRSYLLNLFSGALPIVLYLTITAGTVFLLFQGIEMFRRYKRKMLELNIY